MRCKAVVLCLAGLAFAGAVSPACALTDTQDDATIATELAEAHGLPDAADLAAEHRNMIRILMGDGAGHELPSLVYEWTLGEGLAIEVKAAHQTIGDLRVLHRPLDPAHGRGILALRDLLRRSPIPGPGDPPPDKSGRFLVCAHAAWAVVETIENGRVERRVRDACHSDALMDRTLRLSRAAIELFPACGGLAGDHYRSDRHPLEDCMRLHGDIGAAVAVRNRLERLKWPNSRARDRHLADLFAPEAKLTELQGVTNGAQAAATLAAGEPDVLWADRIVASRDEVAVEGRAQHFSAEDDPAAFEAPFIQTWVHKGERWRLVSWTTGSFARKE